MTPCIDSFLITRWPLIKSRNYRKSVGTETAIKINAIDPTICTRGNVTSRASINAVTLFTLFHRWNKISRSSPIFNLDHPIELGLLFSLKSRVKMLRGSPPRNRDRTQSRTRFEKKAENHRLDQFSSRLIFILRISLYIQVHRSFSQSGFNL